MEEGWTEACRKEEKRKKGRRQQAGEDRKKDE